MFIFRRLSYLAALALGFALPVLADEPVLPGEMESVAKVTAADRAAIAKQIAAAEQKITKTVSGITFNSDYDNGSLRDIVAGANSNTFTGTLYTEPGTISPRTYWFRFTMTGGAGRTVTINMSHADSRYPWYRVDNGPWRQMSTTEAPTSTSMVLAIPAGSSVMEVAFYAPYGYQETLDAVNALIADKPYASIEVIGQSTQGRDIHMITIDDTRFADFRKQRVWMHTRAHAGEVTSTHSMLGFLEQLTADDAEGRRLREYGVYHIVPQLNVDGVFMGMTRWTTLGNDLERMWCPPGTGNPEAEPEVLTIKAQIEAFMQTTKPLKIALNMHSTVGSWTDTFFFNHQPGSNGVTDAYSQYQRDYIEDLRQSTAVFDNQNPQTSNLADCIFVESYFYDNFFGAVMAITHEGHYSRRWYDGAYATDEDHREVGRGMARAVIAFLNFPESTPSEPHGWFVD